MWILVSFSDDQIATLYLVVWALLLHFLSQLLIQIWTARFEAAMMSRLIRQFTNKTKNIRSDVSSVITNLKAGSTNLVSVSVSVLNLVLDSLYFLILFLVLDFEAQMDLFIVTFLFTLFLLLLLINWQAGRIFGRRAQLGGSEQTHLLLSLVANFREILLSSKLLNIFKAQITESKLMQSQASNTLNFVNNSWLVTVHITVIVIFFNSNPNNKSNFGQDPTLDLLLVIVFLGYGCKTLINYLILLFTRTPSLKVIFQSLKDEGIFGKMEQQTLQYTWLPNSVVSDTHQKFVERPNLSQLNVNDEHARFMNLIQIINFQFEAGGRLLKIPPTNIYSGRPFLVSGDSGVGKTTFLDCISGLSNAWTGDLLFRTERSQPSDVKFVFLNKSSTALIGVLEETQRFVKRNNDTLTANNKKFLDNSLPNLCQNLKFLNSTSEGRLLLQLLAPALAHKRVSHNCQTHVSSSIARIIQTSSLGELSRLTLLTRLEPALSQIFVLDELLSSVEVGLETRILELISSIYFNSIIIFTSHRATLKDSFEFLDLNKFSKI